MERRIRRHSRHLHIKVFAVSLVSVAAVGLALLKGPSVFEKLRHQVHSKISAHMKLEEIIWEEVGSTNLSNKITKEDLWKISDLKNGQEMLPIKLSDLEKKLLSLPLIESVQIQKKLPSTLFIKYTAHHARALGVRNNKPWLISSSGKWIAPIRHDLDYPTDLPIMLNEDELASELMWLDGLEKELAGVLVHVHEVNSLFRASSIHDRTSAIIELSYPSQRVKVQLIGPSKPQPESYIRLKRVVQYLIKNNILVSVIDLRPGKKVVVNVGKRP